MIRVDPADETRRVDYVLRSLGSEDVPNSRLISQIDFVAAVQDQLAEALGAQPPHDG